MIERRHLRAGWWGLGVYLSLGVVLEVLHATKSGFYLDVGNETRRLFFRLAHAHGTLLSIVNIVYALTLRARPEIASRAASASLLGALFVMPLGFLLGGAWAKDGDPGIGAALVPVGALLLLIGVAIVARAVRE